MLVEWLKRHGFRVDGDAWSRKYSKEVEVAFYGTQTSTFEVRITPLPKVAIDALHVAYIKDGKCYKSKFHTSGYAKAVRGIEATVKYAGYEL